MIRFGLEPFRDGNRLEWLRPNAGQAVSSNSGFSRCDLALEELVAEPYCAFLLRLHILLRRPDHAASILSSPDCMRDEWTERCPNLLVSGRLVVFA